MTSGTPQGFGIRRNAAACLRRIDRTLAAFYGTPEKELGNLEDPLEEAVYIILSFQTDLPRLKATWHDLRRDYPTWGRLQDASVPAVASKIHCGGLQEQKAARIKALLSAVEARTGSLSLESLKSMSEGEAERFLMGLPGLSWKGARCVALYALGHASFPVDGNSFRIFKRTGVIAETAVYRRRGLHDLLQRLVPAKRRKPLHINLVVHGQRTCTPGRPKCSACPLNAFCPRVGVSAHPAEAQRQRAPSKARAQ